MKDTKSTINAKPINIVHNLIILDESGSMEIIKEATISGFNEIVQTVKGAEELYPEQKHFVTLVTFNGLGIKTPLLGKRVKELGPLDGSSYRPDASTPLYDAIGMGISKLNTLLIGKTDYSVLVTILTDGEENSSREYAGPMIKELIEKLKPLGWVFTYIGANHDVERAAAEISISNQLRFEASPAGVAAAFASDKSARGVHMSRLSRGIEASESYFSADDDA